MHGGGPPGIALLQALPLDATLMPGTTRSAGHTTLETSMATYKKADDTRTTTPPPPPPETSFPRALGESAQQIWLAGLGALGRAQEEGGRLFETLVREGREVDRSARGDSGPHADDVRDGLGSTIDDAREQVTAGWERLERLFDGGLQRTLTRMGVPTRRDVTELNARIEALTAELRARDAAARREKARRASADDTAATPRAPGARRGRPKATPAGTATSAVAPGAATSSLSTAAAEPTATGSTAGPAGASATPLPSTSKGPVTGA